MRQLFEDQNLATLRMSLYSLASKHPFFSEIHHNRAESVCRGRRSLPSCLGGGDLDGDDYNIILDVSALVTPFQIGFRSCHLTSILCKPTLLPDPERIVKPGEYQGLPNKTTLTPCTVADVADFVIDYVCL